jgi:hypothetical protein
MSVGDSLKEVSEHAGALVRLELALARTELSRRASETGRAAGLAAAAAAVGVFSFGFALAGAAAGLAEVIPVWAAILAVAGALRVSAALLAAAARARFRKATPPVPTQAIEEAQETVRRLRDGEGNGRGPSG